MPQSGNSLDDILHIKSHFVIQMRDVAVGDELVGEGDVVQDIVQLVVL